MDRYTMQSYSNDKINAARRQADMQRELDRAKKSRRANGDTKSRSKAGVSGWLVSFASALRTLVA